jgi:hypothetical protein
MCTGAELLPWIYAGATAGGTAFAGKKALDLVGDALKPKIDMPKPQGPGENVQASAANAAQNSRRRALLAYGRDRTILAGNEAPAGQGKRLLGQ